MPTIRQPARTAQPMRTAHVIGIFGGTADAKQEMTEQSRNRDRQQIAGRNRERNMGDQRTQHDVDEENDRRECARPRSGATRPGAPCRPTSTSRRRPGSSGANNPTPTARPKLAIAVAAIRPLPISMMRWGIRLKPSMMKTTPAITAGTAITVRSIVMSARNACAKARARHRRNGDVAFHPARQHDRADQEREHGEPKPRRCVHSRRCRAQSSTTTASSHVTPLKCFGHFAGRAAPRNAGSSALDAAVEQLLREQVAALFGDAVRKIVAAQAEKPRLLERRIDFGVTLIEPRRARPRSPDLPAVRRRRADRRAACGARRRHARRFSKPSVAVRRSPRTGSRLVRASPRAGSVMPSRPIDCSI